MNKEERKLLATQKVLIIGDDYNIYRHVLDLLILKNNNSITPEVLDYTIYDYYATYQ
jgi:hypothetical protein